MKRTSKPRVLFVCTGNSCRSQMAEGWLRHLAGDRFEVFSAGIRPTSVHSSAIQVMGEQGMDLSSHRSTSVDEFLGQPFDYVITVCGSANEECPFFPGPAQRFHWDIEDPARVVGTEQEVLEAFRAVRDRLRKEVEAFVATARGEETEIVPRCWVKAGEG